MPSIKKIIIIISGIYSTTVFAQDYFNPLFLGADIDNVADLTYLNNGNDFVPGEYFLDLYLSDDYIDNIKIDFFEDRKTSKVIPCFTKNIIDLIPLNGAGKSMLNLENFGQTSCIDISKAIPDFSYIVDMQSSSIKLAFPNIYTSVILSTLAPEKYWDDGISAFVMNYDFNGSYSKNSGNDDSQSYYISLHNRFNWGPWRFHGNAYMNYNKSGSYNHTEVKSNNIYLQREFTPIKSEFTIGQQTLSSNLFDSFQYVGANLATSTTLFPQSERNYAPPIRGLVSSRSKIVVRQNGNIIHQTYVDPGPYDISGLSAVGTSGDFEVEVTAADGTVTITNIPYSTINNLLKEGVSEYSVSAGYLDNTGSRKRIFTQASYSRGLSMKVTTYMGTQLSSDYRSMGFGLAKDFGNMGAVSFDFITAKSILDNGSTNSGQSYRVLYGKNLLSTGTNFQLTSYRYSTSGYYSFSEAGTKKSTYIDETGSLSNSRLFGRRKNSYQINVNQAMGDFGQIYVWGNRSDFWGGDVSTNLQFGWSKTFNFLTGLTVNATYNKYRYNDDKQNYFYLTFSLPLSDRSSHNHIYLSNSFSYNTSSHNVSNNTSVSGSAFDNKLTFNAFENLNNHSDPHSTSGFSGSYLANIAKFNLGSTLSSSVKQVDYGMSGSVFAHSDGLSFLREAYDTAVLVEAKGAEGARIANAGESIVVGSDGYALVPYAQPYRYNNIEIDAASFSDEFDIEDKVQRTVPTKGAITKVKFDVYSGYNFLINLNYQGKEIPFGASVKDITTGKMAITNDDGTVYLSGVNNNSSYEVTLDSATSCKFTVKFADDFVPNIINKMNLTCVN